MDAEVYPQEILADEEPKYLRRQKPLAIKRRKFGRKAWKTYLRVTMWTATGLAGAWAIYAGGSFLYLSPEMALIHPDQVEITGIQYVPRARVLEIFKEDRAHSILRIPIDERRRQLEALPWVERATVRRALPNKIEVEIVEREPLAFLRQGSEMALVDAHGVILPRPLQGDFSFPVVTGIGPEMTRDEREKRMQLFADFAQQVELAHPGAMDQVNEIDLSDTEDLRATITGLPGAEAAGQSAEPLLVQFGATDFGEKYRTLAGNIAQWRVAAGRVESVDLRFNREAVVNPDTAALASREYARKPVPAPHGSAKHPH